LHRPHPALLPRRLRHPLYLASDPQGATVISYSHDGRERLFTSSKSNPSPSDKAAVRGGVPICWPIFGPPNLDNPLFAQLKQHGFARTSVWQLEDHAAADDTAEGVKAVFSASPLPLSEHRPDSVRAND